MIFRYYSDNLLDLRIYTPDGGVAGDIVMFFLTGRGTTYDHNVVGLFRLHDNYAISGKTDDGKFVLQSSSMTDMYWDRVRKGVMDTYSSGIQTVASLGTVDVTHPADPDYTRHSSMKVLTPTAYNPSLTSANLYGQGNIKGRPIGSSSYKWRPFHFSSRAPTEITLAEKHRFVRTQVLDPVADSGVTESVYPFLFQMGYGTGYLQISFQSFGVTYLVEYENVAGTWTYLRTRTTASYSRALIGEDLFIVDSGPPNYFEIQPTGAMVQLDSVYMYNFNAESRDSIYQGSYTIVEGDNFICGHAYFCFDDEWHYNLYMPNVMSTYIHRRTGATDWTENEEIWNRNCAYGWGSRLDFCPPWNFARKSTICRDGSIEGNINTMFLLNADSVTYDTLAHPYSITIYWHMGAGVNNPHVVATHSNSSTDYTLYRFSSLNGVATYIGAYYMDNHDGAYFTNSYPVPSGEDPNYLINFMELVDDMMSQYYWLMRIEYTTQWEVYPFCHLYDLEVSPALIDGGIQTYELGVSDTQIAIWDNAGEQPEYGIYELETIQEFESTALVYNLIQNATAIASITVDVTIYALTDVRVMVSTSEEGETYTWNPISTHWELHSDDLTACSVTDFNAADFAKLLSEVGSTVWVHVALITLDGTVSPEFKELSASYTRGIDFFQNTEHYLGTAFNVEVVSDTISRFKNLTGSVQYMDCSVHIVT